MSRLNLHKLFYNSTDQTSYLKALDLVKAERELLISARTEIRNTLRTGFTNHNKYIVDRKELLSESAYNSFPLQKNLELKPKFLTQGSWVYGTINKPAKSPPQQIDLDDGIYLPTSFMDVNQPALSSKAYFKIVEEALKPLCTIKGWNLVQKDTCVRVEIQKGKAHIDLPLFAIPDYQFQLIQNSLEKMGISTFDSATLLTENMRISKDQVMLAHRNGTWEHSDPRIIQDWYLKNVDIYGESLRRISRYIKGWRDETFGDCKLSSLILMKCVVDVYNQLQETPDGKRDDLVLLEVAKKLPSLFVKKIESPVNGSQLNNWTDHDRDRFVFAAKIFADKMESASNAINKNLAIDTLREAFGPRLPMLPTAVLIDDSSISDHVLSFAPITVAAPRVRSTISG